MKVRLEVAHSRANVKRVVLTRDAVIGRSPECNLRIAAGQVSRRHCTMLVSERGVFVRDMGSSNGTFIGPQRLEPNVDVPVPPGTELSIGGVRFRVSYELSHGEGDHVITSASTVHHRRHDTLEPRRSSDEIDVVREEDVDPGTVDDSVDRPAADGSSVDSAPDVDDEIPHEASAIEATATEVGADDELADEAYSGSGTVALGEEHEVTAEFDDVLDDVEPLPAFEFESDDAIPVTASDSAIDDSAIDDSAIDGSATEYGKDTDPGAVDPEDTQSITVGPLAADDEPAEVDAGSLSDAEISTTALDVEEDDNDLFDFMTDDEDPDAEDDAVPEFLRNLDD